MWLESALQQVDKLLPLCRELGVLVLIDLHTPPGGRNPAQEMPLFHEKRFQDEFIEIGDKIALCLSLKNVVEWQRDYGVHIYIGEFSAIRWAPGNSALNYLRDVIAARCDRYL